MAAPPDWYPVVLAAKPSIFFVVMRPKGPRQRVIINNMARRAKSKIGVQLEEAIAAAESYATGFAVGTVGQGVWRKILINTSAHIIEMIYHATRRPVDTATVNSLYDISVYCSHAELDWIARGRAGPRSSFAGKACAIQCSTDLLIIMADAGDIPLRMVDGQTEPCLEDHPALEISDVLEPTRPCLLLAWPKDVIHAFLQGHQCETRHISFSANPAGYDMEVLEAQVGSSAGWSGAPLLNRDGQAIGTLHAGSGAFHSYFVVPRHMQALLATARQRATAVVAAREAAAVKAAFLDRVFSAPRRARTAGQRRRGTWQPLG